MKQQAWLQDRDAAGQFYAKHSTLWPSARQVKNFQSEGTAYVCHERGSRKDIHTGKGSPKLLCTYWGCLRGMGYKDRV